MDVYVVCISRAEYFLFVGAVCQKLVGVAGTVFNVMLMGALSMVVS